MRWPIRNQILVPFAGLLVVSVAATAIAAAWSAGRRVERRIVNDLNRVVRTLDPARSGFPLSRNVLETMGGLSGAEFVVLGPDGVRRTGTIEVDPALLAGTTAIRTVDANADTLRSRPSIEHDGTVYYVVAIPRPDVAGRPITLVALYPSAALQQARSEAMWPPLTTGAVLLVGMVLTAAWLSSRVASRIDRVRQKVARIADGDFEPIEATGPNDEIHDLSLSVNRMAEQLLDLREQIGRSERARLLGQLAGGLAHQLRNAATGARLALQLHRRRTVDGVQPANGRPVDTESLDVALRQLTLIEEQIKALLSLGNREQRIDRTGHTGSVGDVLDDVANLVRAACEHERVDFEVEADDFARAGVVSDPEGVRSALLNLVLNAIEAAGPGGDVVVCAEKANDLARPRVTFDVLDSGDGPPADLGDDVFAPFVTSKPEGVGLGLALVRSVAERLGGSVVWSREDGATRFRLVVHTADDLPGRLPD